MWVCSIFPPSLNFSKPLTTEIYYWSGEKTEHTNTQTHTQTETETLPIVQDISLNIEVICINLDWCCRVFSSSKPGLLPRMMFLIT